MKKIPGVLIIFAILVLLAGNVSASLGTAVFAFGRDMSLNLVSAQNPVLGKLIVFALSPQAAVTEGIFGAIAAISPDLAEVLQIGIDPGGEVKKELLGPLYKKLSPEEQQFVSNIQKYKPYVEYAFTPNREAPEGQEMGTFELDKEGNTIWKDPDGKVFAVVPKGYAPETKETKEGRRWLILTVEEENTGKFEFKDEISAYVKKGGEIIIEDNEIVRADFTTAKESIIALHGVNLALPANMSVTSDKEKIEICGKDSFSYSFAEKKTYNIKTSENAPCVSIVRNEISGKSFTFGDFEVTGRKYLTFSGIKQYTGKITIEENGYLLAKNTIMEDQKLGLTVVNNVKELLFFAEPGASEEEISKLYSNYIIPGDTLIINRVKGKDEKEFSVFDLWGEKDTILIEFKEGNKWFDVEKEDRQIFYLKGDAKMVMRGNSDGDLYVKEELGGMITLGDGNHNLYFYKKDGEKVVKISEFGKAGFVPSMMTFEGERRVEVKHDGNVIKFSRCGPGGEWIMEEGLGSLINLIRRTAVSITSRVIAAITGRAISIIGYAEVGLFCRTPVMLNSGEVGEVLIEEVRDEKTGEVKPVATFFKGEEEIKFEKKDLRVVKEPKKRFLRKDYIEPPTKLGDPDATVVAPNPYNYILLEGEKYFIEDLYFIKTEDGKGKLIGKREYQIAEDGGWTSVYTPIPEKAEEKRESGVMTLIEGTVESIEERHKVYEDLGIIKK